MATAVAAPTTNLLDEPDLKARLQQFRRPDNFTNWYYLLRSYALLAAVIGGSVVFFTHRAEWGLHWAWNIPVVVIAVVLIGAGQHQLTVLAHEASHHTLFKNKLLNELVSDWCCMFPMLSTTHHYRLHHLAHHQFVNDPQRDPNVPQVWVNGHWTHFPMTRAEFWRELAKQLWPFNLIRYLRAQAKSNAMPGVRSPYERKDIDRSRMKVALRVAVFYLIGLTTALIGLVIVRPPGAAGRRSGRRLRRRHDFLCPDSEQLVFSVPRPPDVYDADHHAHADDLHDRSGRRGGLVVLLLRPVRAFTSSCCFGSCR